MLWYVIPLGLVLKIIWYERFAAIVQKTREILLYPVIFYIII